MERDPVGRALDCNVTQGSVPQEPSCPALQGTSRDSAFVFFATDKAMEHCVLKIDLESLDRQPNVQKSEWSSECREM
jgi:hypothetical protein